jgi:hypothetical protein
MAVENSTNPHLFGLNSINQIGNSVFGIGVREAQFYVAVGWSK